MQVSAHELRAAKYLRDAASWETAANLAAGAGVSGRAARRFVLYFTAAGLAERLERSPAFFYRWRGKKPTTEYGAQLLKAMRGPA